jgi:cytochrome b pre-mRNA-processing protein 3
MIFKRLFGPSPAQVGGDALYAAAARQARRPGLYGALGAPDTTEGRFEVYSLHVALLLLRMKGRGGAFAETAQAVFDAYVKSLDEALREMGVGDIVMGKRMRKLGEAVYGRMRSLETALAALPERAPLDAVLERTVFGADAKGAGEDAAPASAGLADYVVRATAALDSQPLESLLRDGAAWPDP